MASIFDTTKYILEKLGPMSTMKLQKLCYYAQAWSLVWDGSPLFGEDFRAWKTGPVCEELFLEIRDKDAISTNDVVGKPENLSDNQKDSIDKVLEYYGNHGAQWLGQLTMMEGPWLCAKKSNFSEGKHPAIITKESMVLYYTVLCSSK